MTQTWIWKRCLPLMLIAGCVLSASAKAASDPKDVKVVYSADDGICQPLDLLYEKFNHQPLAEDAEFDGVIVPVWEDVAPSQFAVLGLKRSPLVKDNSYLHDGRRGKWLTGYYRYYGSSKSAHQLIYVEDVPIGSHGGFGTDVWLLKPGVPASLGLDPSGYGPPEQTPGNAPNDIALAVLFSEGPVQDNSPPYPLVTGPYPFNDNANSMMLGTGEVIQRVFVYQNKTVIVARQLGFSTALLYRITDSNSVAPICKFATLQTINENSKK